MVDTGIGGIERRLAILEEERAILNTMYRYAHTIDYGLEEEWVDLFTEDGIFDVHMIKGFESYRIEGKAALASFVASHTRAPYRYHKHLLCEPIISLDGDSAKVVSYLVRLDTDSAGPYPIVFGRYHDHLVKQGDLWKFKQRLVECEAGRPPRK